MSKEAYATLLENNRKWAAHTNNDNLDFFTDLASGQKPTFLYIGCSDSRVTPEIFAQKAPGSIFIHRNIANQVRSTDMNFLSILEYALHELQIKHIIVCGHTGCGGVLSAFEKKTYDIVDDWISPVRSIYYQNQEALDSISDSDKRVEELVKLNVLAQVQNLFKTPVLRAYTSDDSWPQIHGWVFHLESGLIDELELPFAQWKQSGAIPREYPFS